MEWAARRAQGVSGACTIITHYVTVRESTPGLRAGSYFSGWNFSTDCFKPSNPPSKYRSVEERYLCPAQYCTCRSGWVFSQFAITLARSCGKPVKSLYWFFRWPERICKVLFKYGELPVEINNFGFGVVRSSLVGCLWVACGLLVGCL